MYTEAGSLSQNALWIHLEGKKPWSNEFMYYNDFLGEELHLYGEMHNILQFVNHWNYYRFKCNIGDINHYDSCLLSSSHVYAIFCLSLTIQLDGYYFTHHINEEEKLRKIGLLKQH